jgi:hypothetical protein
VRRIDTRLWSQYSPKGKRDESYLGLVDDIFVFACFEGIP